MARMVEENLVEILNRYLAALSSSIKCKVNSLCNEAQNTIYVDIVDVMMDTMAVLFSVSY